MAEWSKAHPAKGVRVKKPFEGSNPSLRQFQPEGSRPTRSTLFAAAPLLRCHHVAALQALVAAPSGSPRARVLEPELRSRAQRLRPPARKAILVDLAASYDRDDLLGLLMSIVGSALSSTTSANLPGSMRTQFFLQAEMPSAVERRHADDLGRLHAGCLHQLHLGDVPPARRTDLVPMAMTPPAASIFRRFS